MNARAAPPETTAPPRRPPAGDPRPSAPVPAPRLRADLCPSVEACCDEACCYLDWMIDRGPGRP
jgi:hypothetical protein